ncbi:hypothetical protein JXB27_04115 [Candidatus Woesearchaeota archaeon]|nr:hypothetical protein [Candidatus Woesearchaeota archaeon]
MGLFSIFSRFERAENSDWSYYSAKKLTKRTELYLAEINKSRYGKSGKYLFYSENRNLLLKLGKRLIVTFGLPEFKVSKKYRNDVSHSKEFVLCVYDFFPDFINMMKNYSNKNVSFSGWKSNAQTLKSYEAKYQERYLQKY